MINIKEFLGLSCYVSPLDQFLNEFDKTHPKLSLSQQREQKKFARIYKLRDYPTQPETPENFWEKF